MVLVSENRNTDVNLQSSPIFAEVDECWKIWQVYIDLAHSLNMSPILSIVASSCNAVKADTCQRQAEAVIRVARGPKRAIPPKVLAYLVTFFLWEAVHQTKYCCSLKVKRFSPKKCTGSSWSTARANTWLLMHAMKHRMHSSSAQSVPYRLRTLFIHS